MHHLFLTSFSSFSWPSLGLLWDVKVFQSQFYFFRDHAKLNGRKLLMMDTGISGHK